MTRFAASVVAFAAVVTVAVGLSACGGGGTSNQAGVSSTPITQASAPITPSSIPSDAVAQVGNTSITRTGLDHWMSVYAAAQSQGAAGTKTHKPEKQLKSEVLGVLMQSEWLEGEAKEHGVKVSAAEVQSEVNQLKTKLPEAFRKLMAVFKGSTADLLLQVKLYLLSSKIERHVLLASKLGKGKKDVSEAELAKYEAGVVKAYNEHKSQYAEPERRSVQIILTKTEAKAKRAKSEVQKAEREAFKKKAGEFLSGKAFASLAKKDSIAPSSKNNGGELLRVSPDVYSFVKGEERAQGQGAALNLGSQAVFAANPNTLGGPIKSSAGYYIFEVTGITPAVQEPLAWAKAQSITAGASPGFDRFMTEFQTKWKARTNCRGGYVIAVCKQYKRKSQSIFFHPANLVETDLRELGTMEARTGR